MFEEDSEQEIVHNQNHQKIFIVTPTSSQATYLNKRLPARFSLQLVQAPFIEPGWKSKDLANHPENQESDGKDDESDDSIDPRQVAIPRSMIPQYGILKQLQKSYSGQLFLYPVNPIYLGIPYYFKIIKKPMDLSTIENKLSTGRYSCPKDFHQDIELMISNSLIFNFDNEEVLTMTYKFKQFYEETCRSHQIIREESLTHKKRQNYDLFKSVLKTKKKKNKKITKLNESQMKMTAKLLKKHARDRMELIDMVLKRYKMPQTKQFIFNELSNEIQVGLYEMVLNWQKGENPSQNERSKTEHQSDDNQEDDEDGE